MTTSSIVALLASLWISQWSRMIMGGLPYRGEGLCQTCFPGWGKSPKLLVHGISIKAINLASKTTFSYHPPSKRKKIRRTIRTAICKKRYAQVFNTTPKNSISDARSRIPKRKNKKKTIFIPNTLVSRKKKKPNPKQNKNIQTKPFSIKRSQNESRLVGKIVTELDRRR